MNGCNFKSIINLNKLYFYESNEYIYTIHTDHLFQEKDVIIT